VVVEQNYQVEKRPLCPIQFHMIRILTNNLIHDICLCGHNYLSYTRCWLYRQSAWSIQIQSTLSDTLLPVDITSYVRIPQASLLSTEHPIHLATLRAGHLWTYRFWLWDPSTPLILETIFQDSWTDVRVILVSIACVTATVASQYVTLSVAFSQAPVFSNGHSSLTSSNTKGQ